MNTIRTAIVSFVVTLALATAVYFALAPQTAHAASGCTAPAASWLSTEALKSMLNGRYEHRVGLPR